MSVVGLIGEFTYPTEVVVDFAEFALSLGVFLGSLFLPFVVLDQLLRCKRRALGIPISPEGRSDPR
jgi:hypothetical protein